VSRAMENLSFGENRSVPISETLTSAERRQNRRKSLVWRGRLRVDCGRTLDCAILDFSAHGAKLLVEPGPPVGTAVTLIAARIGALSAHVAWVEPTLIGIEFDHPTNIVL
jgi:hypothetical protein